MYDNNGNYVAQITELIAVVAMIIFLAYTAGQIYGNKDEEDGSQMQYEQNTNIDSRSVEAFKIEVHNYE